MVPATVDRLRQRNLTCSRSTQQHDCCIPALLNELGNYRADFTRPLQVLCHRLRWNFALLRRIAIEWQARNSSEETLFGSDLTVVVTESLWRDETGRRDEWDRCIQGDYEEALAKFLQDIRDCLPPTTMGGRGDTGHISPTTAFVQDKAQKFTVQVKSIGVE
ncbi:hypothetical protein A1O7_03095 [Cladophialophora yegresii CBS 114405]|uniref:Uncharacterized protein n=1 Tax=Cladophialophora yegresii CBS 114405 TaxID=1182544 RepID=W9W3M3_9EURO|nr:uncharacterized protein A1O7_03095 [Cladophialophora yegresii CBS 114405]EXJ62657.1 hypothetical protein A1O7_03095 [Cladophialophora yegresii CBS 114405]